MFVIKASLKCSDLCQCVGCQNDVDGVNGHEEIEADSDLDISNSCDDYSTDEGSDTACECVLVIFKLFFSYWPNMVKKGLTNNDFNLTFKNRISIFNREH